MQEGLCAPTPETVVGDIQLAVVSDDCVSQATGGLQHQSAMATQAAQETPDNNHQTTATAQAILSNANSSNKNTEVERHELECQKSSRCHPHLRARSRSPPRSDGSRAAQTYRTREWSEAAHQPGPLAPNARNAPPSAVNAPPTPTPAPASPLNSPTAAAAEAGVVPHALRMQKKRQPKEAPKPNSKPMPTPKVSPWVGYPGGSPAGMATAMHGPSQHVVLSLTGGNPFQYATAPMQAPMPIPAHAGLRKAAGSAQADGSSGSPAPLQQPAAKKKQRQGECGVPSSPPLPTPAATLTPTLTPPAHRSQGPSQPLHGTCGFPDGPMSPVSVLPSPRSIGGAGGPPVLSRPIQRSPYLSASTGSNSSPMLEIPHQLPLGNVTLQSPYLLQPTASTSTTGRGGIGEASQISIESRSSSGADWQQWPVLQRPPPTSTAITGTYTLGSQAGPTATTSAWETHTLASKGYMASAGGVGFVGKTPPLKQHTNTFNSRSYGARTASTATTPHSMGGLEPKDLPIGILGGPDPPSVTLDAWQLQQPHASAARSPSSPLQQSQHYPPLSEHRHPHHQMQSTRPKQSQQQQRQYFGGGLKRPALPLSTDTPAPAAKRQQQQGPPKAQPRQHRLQQLPLSPLPLLAGSTVHPRGAGAGSSANAFPYNHPLMPGTAIPMPATMHSHSPMQMPMPTQIPMLGQQQQAYQPRAGSAAVVSLIAPLSRFHLDRETE